MSSEFRICVLLCNAWKEILITCLGVTNGFEVVFQSWGFQFIWGRRLEQTALLLEDSGSGDAFINSVSCYLVLWKIICHFILCIKQVRQFGGYSLLPVTCCCVGMNSVAARSSTCPYKFKKKQNKVKPRNVTQVLMGFNYYSNRRASFSGIYPHTQNTLTAMNVCAHTHTQADGPGWNFKAHTTVQIERDPLIWFSLSWEEEPRWDYLALCPISSWKPPVIGTLPRPWGR